MDMKLISEWLKYELMEHVGLFCANISMRSLSLSLRVGGRAKDLHTYNESSFTLLKMSYHFT